MLNVLDSHKNLYEARWNEEDISLVKRLEIEFLSLAENEGLELETINLMLKQLYIPPYKYSLLPEHLRYSNLTKKGNLGRPSMGVTKKVSITLPSDIWEDIDKEIKQRKDIKSMSGFLREIILDHFIEKDFEQSKGRLK